MIRISCNGCRVLRKGCSRDCPLRPCLEWIQSPESQANATLFLAKFYGRAGLINLINSGPVHLRPAIFGSLLYEACGRIINPIHGSVGLMTSGNWQRCQAAVEAVLNGAPLMQVDDSTIMPLQGGDIRHLSKTAAAAEAIHGFRTRKRSTARKINNPLHKVTAAAELVKGSTEKFTITGWVYGGGEFMDHQRDSQSVETVEPTLLKPGKTEPRDDEVGLELTLGFNPVRHNLPSTVIELSDDSEL